jgi:dCTP deaminase
MILTGSDVLQLLESDAGDRNDRLAIVPFHKEQVTSSSVDLRLGTWFATHRTTDVPLISLAGSGGGKSPRPAQQAPRIQMSQRFIPFGSLFTLHPRSFVLASTLEWIRLPSSLAATVEGRSSLGRSGLSIATATTVHPHFTGCLTLELSNMGEVPLQISPGMLVCQLVVHRLSGAAPRPTHSSHSGYRKPIMNPVRQDDIARRLAEPSSP